MNQSSINAWKDPTYRASLTAEEVAALPPNPAGSTWSALDQSQVKQIVGAVPDGDPSVQAESGGYICTYTTECFTTWCCP